jgi:hypothetical protein
MKNYFYWVILIMVTEIPARANLIQPPMEPDTFIPADTFPVPSHVDHLMFYIQRTPNINTIAYELNFSASGQLDIDNPIHVFWIRYKEDSSRAELSFIQRNYAYGLKIRQLGKDYYDLRFVSYKKYPLYLRKSEDDKKYHVYATINNKRIILNRIFLHIEGGTFWLPNVTRIELSGVDADTGKELIDFINP